MLKNNQISNSQKPSLLTIGLNFYASLSLLLGTMPALANEPSIIADPGASNRPDILKAPNETLIINITNPDSKGVSINEYSRFNTPPTGTILNNSNKNIDTKIAGQIDANYRLNKEASLIINKVNSAEKSSLKGNLEVAGSRADVVIANPNGISVDGLNMINSRSLTLTTGNINKLSPKEIELISNNSIDIVGDGLNDKSSDYTNVISNAINLNSNIHANELNIIGEKAVASSKDRLYNDVKAKNQENSFSLDSSALGGMYANKIKLVGTSNGVGVNNNGLVIANNNIEISLDGDIVNAGAIASNKEANIKANTITNKDEALIAAKESLNIKADTLVNTSSQIYAKDINVEAKKLVNNSSSQARVDTVHKQGTMHLKKEGVNRYKLGVNLKELKEKISIKLAKKLGKDISELDEKEVNELVLKEAANKDGALYALNLHKDSHLVGTSQKIFHNLRLDYDTNEVVVDTRRAEKNEQKRTITYSIVKDVLNEDDKAKFIPGSIIANNDINLNVNDVLNDKSVIYAGGDLRLNSDNVENIALMLNNHINSYSVYKWKEKKKWYRGGGWKTKGGTGKVFNFSYTDVGLPAVFAAGNNIVGSTQDFSSYALNDDIKLANVDLDKFSEPIFNSPIIKNLNRRVKNQGYYYSLDSINSAYIANILDGLYEARNESISKFKKEAKDKNVKASALVMANNIDLDAKGNISLAGSVVADSLNLNADKKIKLKGAELSTSGDANIVANDIEIDSSDLSSKNLNINAKSNINLDQSKSHFSKVSNLETTNDINLQAGNDIKVSGSNLDASGDINLNSGNDIEIKADEFSYTHHASSKGMKFDESVKRVSAANLNANSDINLNAKNTLVVSSSHLNSLKDINLKASDIILAAQSNSSEATAINSSKSLLSKKQTIDSAVSSEVVSTSLKSGNNINLNSANDIYLVSSKLKSDKDINLNSNNNILFENGYNVEASSHASKKSKISLNPNAFYKSSFDLVANGSKKAVYNTIDSGSDINLNAKSALSLKGANLNSGSDINLNAELIAISNTNDESYHKEEHKSSRVGILKPNEVLKDIVVDLKRKLNPLKEAKDKFSSLSTPTFVIGKTSTKFESNNQEAKSSNIKAGKNININANKDINIVASNVDAKENLNLKANEAIEISSTNSISNAKSESVSRKILGKQSASASSTNEEVVSSNLNAKNINIASNQDTTLLGSNIIADESLDIKADNINLLPATYSLESSSKFKDSGFGDLMKSNGEESSSNYNLAISTLSAKDISLNSNTINALASIIEATNVDVNTKLLNLVSAKSTSVNTTLSNNAGVLTATVKNKGKIEEVEIPAIIKVKDKFTLNGKDITNKLDATTFKAINDSLNSEEFKEGVIRELRSNSDTPIDEETINQVKAVLNSKEWEDKTTTLSGMGALIITAIVTFLTAGAGGAVAAGVLGSAAAASSTAGLAISAMTTAVIANSTVQLTNNLLSHGKVKFDASSLAKSAISAGVGSYVSNYISSISTLSNTNIINTPTYTFSYADLLSSTSNAAINSAIYKTNFKDALLSNLISKATDNAYKAVGSYSSNEANINSNALFKESGLGKIALHSAVGALSAKLSHENVAAGALSGAVNEAISSALHKDTSNMSTKEIEAYNNKRLLASQLIGIIAGGIANGDEGANTGYKITTSADTYNRQLHQREIDFINNKNNIESFKSKLQTTTNKIYSDDEAKSILAKAAVSLTDKSFNETYRQSLSSNDLYNIELATNFIKQSSFYNTSLDNTNAFNPDKKQYEDRYVYLDSFTNNREFYDKNLKVDTKLSNDIANFATGFAKGGINLVKDTITGVYYLVSNPVKTGDTILRNSPDIISALPSAIKNGLDKGELDIVLGDYESVTARDTGALGTLFGGAAIASNTGKMAKMVKDAGNEVILGIATRLSPYTVVDTINISGKEFIKIGVNHVTGNPIVRQVRKVGNDFAKNDFVTFGNRYELGNNGLTLIGKNSLNKSNIKVNESPKFYDAKSPEEIISIGERKFSDFINSYAPSGLPEFTFAGGAGWILSDPSEQIKDSYFALKSRIGDFMNYIQSEQDK
ncbi:filamentous hemagglutinin N-terminal domain-containing protein [Campylobacter concisus]|uniref:two-partner secretion domain-containing protein n=1 Tax=Campylobacter concisus TaxID=199 RepID=UPI001652C47B|nr:filamentous hemagglutinin N-terminal domain-containing protein [Campylobacter concisus]